MSRIRFLFIGSLCITLLCFFGFLWTYLDQKVIHQAVPVIPLPEKSQQMSELRIVALGDSLTHGYGDASGKGYIGDVIDQVRSRTDATISLSNLAINGQTSGQLLKQMDQKEVQRQIGQADVIIMSIGGNDLNQHGQTMSDLEPSHIGNLLESYQKNLTMIMKQIRSVNVHASVYMIGLYNPYINTATVKTTSQFIRQWNNETTAILDQFPKTIFVPTFDLFQQDEEQYLYTDHFHPNSKGYQRIANRIVPLISP